MSAAAKDKEPLIDSKESEVHGPPAPTGLIVGHISGIGNGGFADGNSVSAQFNGPIGLTIDPFNDMQYIADTNNHCVRAIAIDNSVLKLSGSGKRGWKDAQNLEAELNEPKGVAFDPHTGMVYVADTGNRRIRLITRFSELETVAGSGSTPANSADGKAMDVTFDSPQFLSFHADSKHLYIGDTGAKCVRIFDTVEKTVSTLMIGGKKASFASLSGLAVTPNGVTYVLDGADLWVIELDGTGSKLTTLNALKPAASLDGKTDAKSKPPAHALYIESDGRTGYLAYADGGFTCINLKNGAQTPVTLTAKTHIWHSPSGIVRDHFGVWYILDNSTHRLYSVATQTEMDQRNAHADRMCRTCQQDVCAIA